MDVMLLKLALVQMESVQTINFNRKTLNARVLQMAECAMEVIPAMVKASVSTNFCQPQ